MHKSAAASAATSAVGATDAADDGVAVVVWGDPVALFFGIAPRCAPVTPLFSVIVVASPGTAVVTGAAAAAASALVAPSISSKKTLEPADAGTAAKVGKM